MNETDRGAYKGIQLRPKCNSIIYIHRHTKKRECCLANNQVNQEKVMLRITSLKQQKYDILNIEI